VILACTVLIQITSVTDRRTDGGQTDRRPDDGKDARSILLSRVKTRSTAATMMGRPAADRTAYNWRPASDFWSRKKAIS